MKSCSLNGGKDTEYNGFGFGDIFKTFAMEYSVIFEMEQFGRLYTYHNYSIILAFLILGKH